MRRLGCGCSAILLWLGAAVGLVTILGFLTGPLGAKFTGLKLFGSLSVKQPHPELPAEPILRILGFPITNTILASWLTVLVLFLLFYFGTRRTHPVPRGLQNLTEWVVEKLLRFTEGVAGRENGRRFFPVVATIFLFVIMNAWMSLLPGFGSIGFWVVEHGKEKFIHLLRGANTDLNMPLALALMSFVFVEWWGIRSIGFFRYTGTFINVRNLLRGRPMGFVDFFVGILEVISHLARIISFTFRLFGNMTAGEILLLVGFFLLTWGAGNLVFYGLELLVGFVQALVFGGLTLVFATLAVTPHAEEHQGHEK